MPKSILIDSNILIDVWGPPGAMKDWSRGALTSCRSDGALIVNSIVWAELAPLAEEAVLEAMREELEIHREVPPWAAAYPAGHAHALYRRAGGRRERTLPDFLVGAHALVAGHALLTRDPARYRSYFPDLVIIAPDTHP